MVAVAVVVAVAVAVVVVLVVVVAVAGAVGVGVVVVLVLVVAVAVVVVVVVVVVVAVAGVVVVAVAGAVGAVTPRAKGVRFEREVADAFRAAGFSVRGLEGEGDHLCLRRDGLTLHSECKRQEKVRLREWWAQTTAEAAPGTTPCLTLRWNRGEMLTVLRTADFLRLVAE